MSAEASRGRRWLLLVLSASLAAVGWLGVAKPAHADGPTKVLLLLDVSGSMNDKIASGGTKFAAGKRALKQVADALPPSTEVGLRVYGSQIAEPKSQNPRACTDTELVLPTGPLDRSTMYRAVDSFKAKGETPIAYSLEKSVNDLGKTGKRVLVLISDGEETCKADPCPTARRLAKSGIDLQFNAVGLAVNGGARQQLQCIANAGDGNYYDASNSSELSTALLKVTQRALRPFHTAGTAVKGTVDIAGAPQITPGQYRDAYDATRIDRYYQVRRTPGSTVTASIATIVRPFPTQNTEFWKLALTTRNGTECAASSFSSASFHVTQVATGAVRSGTSDPVSASPSASPGRSHCDSDPLLLSLSRYSPLGNSQRVPVEILISEEPPIRNLSALPKGLSTYTGEGDAVRATTPVRTALGGTSFSNAAAVGAGSWSDTLAIAETVFYRVHLEPGQRVRVSAETPAPKTRWRPSKIDIITTRVGILSPARVRLTEQRDDLQGPGAMLLTAASPEVRVRNRQAPMPADPTTANQWSTASVAGDYFISLQVEPLGADLSGRVMKVQLDIAVDGKPVGQPQYVEQSSSASPTATPSLTPSPEESSTPSPEASGSAEPAGAAPVGLAVGGASLLALLMAGGAVWWRRSRSSGR